MIAMLIIANFCVGCSSGGVGPVPSEMTTNFPATVYAIAHMVSCSAGFLAPYVIGVILESNAGDLQYLWSLVFYISAALAVMGIVIFIAFGEGRSFAIPLIFWKFLKKIFFSLGDIASVQQWDNHQRKYDMSAVATEECDDENFVGTDDEQVALALSWT